uniref:Uncharacterized protein n=1 Tax=Panagrolaimus superbus TaxID=310955 RepID=A0A914YLU7_9BILA
MPPPDVFKAYNKAAGTNFEKLQTTESKNESENEKEEIIEIDTTKPETLIETDSSAVKQRSPPKRRSLRSSNLKKENEKEQNKMDESDSSVCYSNAKIKTRKGRQSALKKLNEKQKDETVKSKNITVSESEMEVESNNSANESSKAKRGRPKKRKGYGGRQKKEEEPPSKWPKFTEITARCYIENCGHKGGCAAYSVNHEMKYKYHGKFDQECKHCGAYLNEFEKKTPSLANKCCNNGDLCTEEIEKIQEILDNIPKLLKDLLDDDQPDSKKFKPKSHIYNKLVGFGTIQTKSILPPLPGGPGGGPNVIRMNGDMEYAASDLFPPEGKKAAFGQLYCIDLQNAETNVSEKAKEFKVSEGIAKLLLNMVKDNHVFADLFKTASEKFAELAIEAQEQNKEMPQFKCIIVDSRDESFTVSDKSIHVHSAEKPRNELIGMIWSNDNGEPPEYKGIWLNGRNGQTHFVPYWSPNVDPLCYPILFPYGTQIYHNGMELKKVEEKKKAKKIIEEDTDVSEADVDRHINGSDDDANVDEDELEDDKTNKRKIKGRRFASRKQVTRYFLYPRNKKGFKSPHWLWSKGPIADAWLIDMVCRAERSQLDVARKKVENMKKRCTTTKELQKYIEGKYLNNKKLGSMFTIPKGFKGGRKKY